jgi:hypothetical protein
MRSALAAVALLAACSPEEGPLMAPGQDCLECHTGGDARRWTAAGTWLRGSHVQITDANGKTVSLRGNKVGNFYTAEPLAPPFTVSVDGSVMPALPDGRALAYGGCNICHQSGGTVELADMASGRDCLACHDGARAKRFYAAGTWTPGATVTVRGANGASATVVARPGSGNFYVETPLTPPFSASVNGSTMDPPPTYGGCNACHGSGGAHED